MRKCENLHCDRLGTRVLQLEGTNRITRQPEGYDLCLCDEHYAERSTPCMADGCPNLAILVIAVRGHSITDGEYREDEAWLCEPCWDAFQQSTTATINGVRMVHDGTGQLKALPENPGRG